MECSVCKTKCDNIDEQMECEDSHRMIDMGIILNIENMKKLIDREEVHVEVEGKLIGIIATLQWKPSMACP